MKQKINEQEVMTGLQEFLQGFGNVSSLYKRAAEGMASLLFVQRQFNTAELDDVVDMVNDYMCVLKLLEPLETSKEEKV